MLMLLSHCHHHWWSTRLAAWVILVWSNWLCSYTIHLGYENLTTFTATLWEWLWVNYTQPLSFSWKHTCLSRQAVFTFSNSTQASSYIAYWSHECTKFFFLLLLKSSTWNLLQRHFQPFCANLWFNQTHSYVSNSQGMNHKIQWPQKNLSE